MANDKHELYESTSARDWGLRRKSGYIKNKSKLNSKIHLAVNEHGMLIKFIFMEETHTDYQRSY